MNGSDTLVLRAVEKGCFIDGQLSLAALCNEGLVGTVDLYNYDPINNRAAVGIVVKEALRRQGYGRAMLKALDTLCCEQLNLHQVYCDIVEGNKASLRLFLSCDYRQIGLMHGWVLVGDSYRDVVRLQKIFSNVFDKPNADKLACMLRRENDCFKESNVFDKPNADKLACMLRREND